MVLENKKIREFARKRGVPLWRIADARGVSEATITRLLRRPLSSKIEKEILLQIESLSQETRHAED